MVCFGVWRNFGLRLHGICAMRRLVRRCGLRRGSLATATSSDERQRAEVSPVRGRTFSIAPGVLVGRTFSIGARQRLVAPAWPIAIAWPTPAHIGALSMMLTMGERPPGRWGGEREHQHTRPDVFHRTVARRRRMLRPCRAPAPSGCFPSPLSLMPAGRFPLAAGRQVRGRSGEVETPAPAIRGGSRPASRERSAGTACRRRHPRRTPARVPCPDRRTIAAARCPWRSGAGRCRVRRARGSA